MRLIRGPRLRQSGCICLAITALFITISIFLVVSAKHAQYSRNPVLSPFLEYMLASGTRNKNSKNGQYSPCECPVTSTPVASVDENVQQKGDSSTSMDETLPRENEWRFIFGRDDSDRALDDQDCDASFPGLFEEINRATKFRGYRVILLQELESIKISNGMVRAMIFDRQLYVLAANFKDHEHRKKGIAILATLYRAIAVTPLDYSLPNIEWIFTIEDYPIDSQKPIWSLSRRVQDENFWLMPEFDFWGGAFEGLGPFDVTVSQIVSDKIDSCWDCRQRKAVWRGTVWTTPNPRRDLVEMSRGKPWSDIEALRVEKEGHANYLSAAEHCAYMFIIHAEGLGSIGSLKHRLACRSVLILQNHSYIPYYHSLLKPSGPSQNHVSVQHDFSNLESTILTLLMNPPEAKRIADNSVKTFRERYLTPAAEACYWRKLIKAWRAVSFEPELYEMVQVSAKPAKTVRRTRGIRWESYSILETDRQMRFNVG